MKRVKLCPFSLVRISVIAAVAIASVGGSAGQGTENLPTGDRTKEFELRGMPPVDPEPVVNPGVNPITPSLVVPEPATTALLALGGAGALAAAILRRRRKS